MKKERLTPAQVEVLRELARIGNQAVLTSDNVKRRVFWRVWYEKIHIGYNKTPTVKALIRRGLVESPSGILATITSKGRDFLAKLDIEL